MAEIAHQVHECNIRCTCLIARSTDQNAWLVKYGELCLSRYWSFICDIVFHIQGPSTARWGLAHDADRRTTGAWQMIDISIHREIVIAHQFFFVVPWPAVQPAFMDSCRLELVLFCSANLATCNAFPNFMFVFCFKCHKAYLQLILWCKHQYCCCNLNHVPFEWWI